MLGMYKCLPDPDREDDILPTLNLNMMTVFIIRSFGQELLHCFFAMLLAWVLFVFELLKHLLKLLETLLVLFIVQSILDLYQ